MPESPARSVCRKRTAFPKRTQRTALLELELGAPEAVDPVFEFLGQAQLAAVGGVRIVAVVAKRFDGALAGIRIRHADFKIRHGWTRTCQRQNCTCSSQYENATHSRLQGRAPVDRGRLRLDGCRRSGLAWRGGWHASRHAHQATDAEQRTEVEHDLDTGRLCRITDQYV